MFSFRIKILLILVLVVLIQVNHSQAGERERPIEGSTKEAVDENRDILQSVVKFSEAGREVFCTATLVDQNILLTARHCIEDLRPGGLFTLNGKESAYKALQMAAIKEPRPTVPYSYSIGYQLSDFTLILFTAVDCDQSPLANVKPLPLASAAQAASFASSKVLLAGYGSLTTEPSARQLDKSLHAGYSNWSVNAYGACQDPVRAKNVSDQVFKYTQSHYPSPGLVGEALIQVQRETTRTFYGKKGSIFSINARSTTDETKLLAGGASALPGDSGGPAIAWDTQNKPHVVGVVGSGEAFMLNSTGVDETLLVTAGDQEIFKAVIHDSTPSDPYSPVLLAQLNKALFLLMQKDYLRNMNQVQKDFKIQKIVKSQGFSAYSSVLAPRNSEYLMKSLNMLQKTRDGFLADDRVVCQ